MNKIMSTIILLAALFLGSCTTMSFIPTEGSAAKFNLATVDYVQAQSDSLRADLIDDLAGNLTILLDSLLMEDRAALEALSMQLDSLNSTIDDFAGAIDSSELFIKKSMALMSKELTTVKTNASSTRMVIRRINDNIDNLPLKALEAFNAAINEYLKKDEVAPE